MSRGPAPPAVARLRDWVFKNALPLWAERGFDHGRGGFVEALAEDGAPLLELDRRVLVQARQIYVFSHAALLDRAGPGAALAAAGFARLTRSYWHADGGWIFSATPDGRPRDLRRRTYDQAFVAFALAWYHRAHGGGDALHWATRTLDFLDRRLADPRHGGFGEGLPATASRRQNPHMHLLEAALALHAATGDTRHLGRARALVELFRRHFFDAGRGTLREHFAPDWGPDDAGERLEPGHHYEWVWLLHRYARQAGEDLGTAAAALYAFAERHGVDPADGLVRDGVRPDGSAWAEGKRLWPQCEALRAQAALAAWLGQDTSARVVALVEGLFRRHLAAPPGLWHERVAADGAPVPGPIPATSLYHLMGAATAFDELG